MNRVVLITGSSRGIGKATAEEFARRGDNVIVNYVNSKEAAEQLCHTLTERYSVQVIAIQADLAKEEEVRALAAQALERFGRVDVLVNNAGIALYTEVPDKTVADWNLTLQTNLIAPFLLSQLLGAEMMKKQYGKIVNISSIDAIYTYNAPSMEYDASKAALINLTQNFALALRPYVNVNCVAPGWVETDMNKDLPPELVEMQTAKICKKRFAKPEEIAKLVAFLASDDAEFINSETIKIDGGYQLT